MVVETRGVRQLTGHHSADTTLRPCNTEGQSWQTLRRAQDAALTHQCWIRAGQGCPSLPCIPAAGRAPLFNALPPLEQLFAKRRDCPYAAGASLRPSVRPSVHPWRGGRPSARPAARSGAAAAGRAAGAGAVARTPSPWERAAGGQRRAGSSGRGSVRAGGTGPPPAAQGLRRRRRPAAARGSAAPWEAGRGKAPQAADASPAARGMSDGDAEQGAMPAAPAPAHVGLRKESLVVAKRRLPGVASGAEELSA
ncbi:uncharacterized protein [Ciconia boyciana]|uniref:uncharacterized protein n=1 Tax=Ciconia boyciana TaxID=52775 RepID=UPI003B9FD665